MNPRFLTLKTQRPGSAAEWAAAASSARCAVLAAADAGAVKPLEAGTTHTGLVILRFAFAEDLAAFWRSAGDLAAADPDLVALAAGGIAYEGWPGHAVPTIATVNVPDAGAPRTFMVIEGTGTDETRMDRYRDIILPMLRERSAYYIAFELGGDVDVLAGRWSEGIFAISRWPSWALAEDFWSCDRYQKEAIPVRAGVGRFDVQIVEGIAG